ncbi:serine/arginine repetitive matrix protein 3-like [Sciurus carolinensis]|uniref:serine/arginine repetitive matrix protein 3-like n=1 Tax=Sciurus carolinensis TaxID=30640 RepID=UPI001FB22E2D|nr:serine/arginine repetitive matrix protein 3-like [Sciurus carolinensis]
MSAGGSGGCRVRARDQEQLPGRARRRRTSEAAATASSAAAAELRLPRNGRLKGRARRGASERARGAEGRKRRGEGGDVNGGRGRGRWRGREGEGAGGSSSRLGGRGARSLEAHRSVRGAPRGSPRLPGARIQPRRLGPGTLRPGDLRTSRHRRRRRRRCFGACEARAGRRSGQGPARLPVPAAASPPGGRSLGGRRLHRAHWSPSRAEPESHRHRCHRRSRAPSQRSLPGCGGRRAGAARGRALGLMLKTGPSAARASGLVMGVLYPCGIVGSCSVLWMIDNFSCRQAGLIFSLELGPLNVTESHLMSYCNHSNPPHPEGRCLQTSKVATYTECG